MRGELVDRVEAAVGRRVSGYRRAERGYTAAERWIVTLDDGSRIFVKASTSDDTASWLRREHCVYSSVDGTFLPRLVAWDDDELPVLVLEDLGDRPWPPPWDAPRIESVLEALRAVAAAPPPAGLPSMDDFRRSMAGFDWPSVAADPAPFLSLGMCSSSWLDGALPELLRAQEAAPVEGNSLLHLDVRSDNICFVDGRAVLVDWNWASVGNPEFDVATWLPSLCAEGGPLPESVLPGAGAFASAIAGYYASVAGRPAPEGASPRVRVLQRAQLEVALPWAVRVLGLPPLDGRLG